MIQGGRDAGRALVAVARHSARRQSATAGACPPSLASRHCTFDRQKQMGTSCIDLPSTSVAGMAHADSVSAMIHRLRGSGGSRLAQAQAAHQLCNRAECCNRCCSKMMAAGALEALVTVLIQPNSLPAAKQWAARTLGVLAADGDSSRCEAIAAAGAVPALLQGLVSDSPAEVQIAAAGTLADLTASPAPEISLAACAAGGVQLLVPLLSSRQGEVRHTAAVALSNLAADSYECRSTLAASALPALVRLLQDDDPAVTAQILAAMMEDKLGYSEAVVRNGALPHLLRLLSHSSQQQRESAAGAVRALVCDGQAEAAAAAGAVERLICLLRHAGDSWAAAEAARALNILTIDCPECCEEVTAALPSLVSLLGSSKSLAPGYAASTLDTVLSECEDAAWTVFDCGAVPALVRAMQQPGAAHYVLQWSAASLSHLADIPGAASQLEAAGGVSLLVKLLGHSDALVRQSTASVAASLASQIGSQLVAAGAIRALLGALQRGIAEQDTDLQMAAASALEQLAAGSDRHARFIVASGGIAALRPMLGCKPQQFAAAQVLRELAAVEPAALEGLPEESESEAESSYYTDSDDWCSSSGGGQPGAEAAAAQPQQQAEERHCAVCGATRAAAVKLRLCAGCRTPGLYFCGLECQRQFWPSHRAACRAAAAAARREHS